MYQLCSYVVYILVIVLRSLRTYILRASDRNSNISFCGSHGITQSSTPFSGLPCLTSEEVERVTLHRQASQGLTTRLVKLWCNKVSLQWQKDPALRAGRGHSSKARCSSSRTCLCIFSSLPFLISSTINRPECCAVSHLSKLADPEKRVVGP